MFYKEKFKRVRPSVLCPALIPPFGPPAHPAFPSGHSFLGHLIALLLLEIPGLALRYGVFEDPDQALNGVKGRAPVWTDLNGTDPIRSPLLWLSGRLAENRERIGVHYPTDSSFSRHLAAGIWDALLHGRNPHPTNRINCPTLEDTLDKARAEWPADWPPAPVP